jgi:hypothetical protein
MREFFIPMKTAGYQMHCFHQVVKMERNISLKAFKYKLRDMKQERKIINGNNIYSQHSTEMSELS